MTKVDLNKIFIRIREYAKKNWGSPFIVAFMLLLFSAAISLSVGLSYVANAVSDYAFYTLAVGIALQLACFLKYEKVRDAV